TQSKSRNEMYFRIADCNSVFGQGSPFLEFLLPGRSEPPIEIAGQRRGGATAACGCEQRISSALQSLARVAARIRCGPQRAHFRLQLFSGLSASGQLGWNPALLVSVGFNHLRRDASCQRAVFATFK